MRLNRCRSCGKRRRSISFPKGGHRRNVCGYCIDKRVPMYAFEPTEKKFCFQCDQMLDLDAFNNMVRGHKGKQHSCRSCHNPMVTEDMERSYAADPVQCWANYVVLNRKTPSSKNSGRTAGSRSLEVSVGFMYRLVHLQGLRCGYCDRLLDFSRKGPTGARVSSATMDACDNDGDYDPSNVIVACLSCNTSKRDREVFGWLSKRNMPDTRFIDVCRLRDRMAQAFSMPIRQVIGGSKEQHTMDTPNDRSRFVSKAHVSVNGTWIPYQQFAEALIPAWQSSPSVGQVALSLGCTKKDAMNAATHLRGLDIPLKTFIRTKTRPRKLPPRGLDVVRLKSIFDQCTI